MIIEVPLLSSFKLDLFTSHFTSGSKRYLNMIVHDYIYYLINYIIYNINYKIYMIMYLDITLIHLEKITSLKLDQSGTSISDRLQIWEKSFQSFLASGSLKFLLLSKIDPPLKSLHLETDPYSTLKIKFRIISCPCISPWSR